METIPLEPVDALTVTTLVDNVADLPLVDEGPAKRYPLVRAVDPSSSSTAARTSGFELGFPLHEAYRDGRWQARTASTP